MRKQDFFLIILLSFTGSFSFGQTGKTEKDSSIRVINDTTEMRVVNGRDRKFVFRTAEGNTLTLKERDELFEKFGSLGQKFGRENDYYVITLFTPNHKNLYDSLSASLRADASRKMDAFTSKWINQPAPAFTLADVSGKVHTLGAASDKVIVLNFWFTACGPCIKEMPVLNEIVQENREKKVAFLSIALDEKEKIIDFLKNRAFNYTAVSSKEFNSKMNIQAWPTHIIIDKKGIIRFIQVGGDNIKEALQKNIEAALKS